MARTIIALTGAAGSGKSTAAEILMSAHGGRRVKFAGPLKSMMRALICSAGGNDHLADRMIEGDLKEAASPLLNGETPRKLMQTLGTEWGRGLHPDFWVSIWGSAVDATPGELIIVDDCRVENEARAVRQLGGKVVQIIRSGAGIGGEHASERPLPLELVDFQVFNSSDIRHLHTLVSNIYYAIR